MGNTKTALATGSFFISSILTYISIVFGELYPKRIAMNLKDELAVRTAPIVILLGKIVEPLCLVAFSIDQPFEPYHANGIR